MDKETLKKSLNPNNLTPEDIKAFRDRYREDPVLFCSEILGLDMDENQRNMALGVLNHRKCCFISARGCGKSVCISALAIWFFSVFPKAKCVLGANTAYQTGVVLWTKILELINGSAISEWFECTENFVYYTGARDLGFITRITCSADKTESLSGFHAANMIYFIDESSAVEDKILTNLLSSCTEENNRFVLTTNPTRSNGFTADVADSPKWHTLHISGYDSKFTNKEWLDELVEKYGRDSDTVRVQVFGEFPKQFSNAICTSLQFNSCIGNKNARPGDVVLGLDVASSGGDLSVWCVRKGGNVIAFVEESSSTVESLVEKTLTLVDRYSVDRIFVDATGMGWSIPEILMNNLPKAEIHGINFASKAPNDKCANYRAYMYTNLSDAIKKGDLGVDKSLDCLMEIREELTSTDSILANDGRIKLEPKEKIREKLGRSPDRSDALALTFATETPFQIDDFSTASSMKSLDESLFYAGLWGSC